MEVQTPKPLLKTLTAKSALLAMLGSALLAIAQTAGNISSRHYPERKEDIADLVNLVDRLGLLLGLGGGIGAIAGRAGASAPTYTAPWLPGPNREDLLVKYTAAIKTAVAIENNPDIPTPDGVVLTEESNN